MAELPERSKYQREAGASSGRMKSRISREKALLAKGVKREKMLHFALYYAFEALVDVVILFIFVRGFSIAFSFSHDVFYDEAMTPGSEEYATVEIDENFTTESVAETLVNSGIVKNKYVMMMKIKVGEYGSKIIPGKYSLSPSMKAKKILEIITGTSKKKKKDNKTSVASSTDAATSGSAGIIDNSNSGAGAGGSEGTLPDDGNSSDDSGNNSNSGENNSNFGGNKSNGSGNGGAASN